MDRPTVKVKISLEGEMRRFSCPLSFKKLAAAAAERFGLKDMNGYVFQYVDAEQDLITVGSSEELREAVADLVDGTATLRMSIVPAGKRISETVAPSEPPVARSFPSEEHLTHLLQAAIEVCEHGILRPYACCPMLCACLTTCTIRQWNWIPRPRWHGWQASAQMT